MFVLKLPLVHALMIGAGIFVVIVGLMLFMEGLRLGLMPLGEVIGSVLPTRSAMAVILGFAFLLGLGATFAEPAIAVLKAAGSGVVAAEAPLLYSLLNEFSGQLVGSVGVGVGFALYGEPVEHGVVAGAAVVVLANIINLFGERRKVGLLSKRSSIKSD